MRSFISLLVPAAGTLLASVHAAPIDNPLSYPDTTGMRHSTIVKRGTWAPAQGGCWSDNVDHVRALEHNAGGANDMTPSKCQDTCEAAGFSLAGVEYGRECYCGNTIMGNNRPNAGICTMSCAGDSTQTCGGPDALNIFVKDSYPYTTGPASPVASYNGYDNAQCWHEGNRILTNSPATSIPADQMTVQKCIDGCAAAGYSSAGLEFGHECSCGNISFPPGNLADINDCGMPCLGDGSQYCGGPSRVLIYNKPGSTGTGPTPTGSWTPAQGGCWSDNVDHVRALDHGAGSADDMTPAKCQSLCEADGFSLAGVEYGRECFCGNTIMGNNRPSANICTMTCSGDSSQKCGGPDAINIYVKDNYPYTVGPASVLPSYNGYDVTQCWQDPSSNRLLKQGPATSIPYDQMTVQKCIDGCAAAGFSSAGVEYGGECYCDNVTYPPGQSQPISECNMGCKGDGSEICGGPNRILIYYKNPAPVFTKGILQIFRADNGDPVGYVSYNSLGGYLYTVTEDESQALMISFPAPPPGTTSVSQVEFTPLNSDVTTRPFAGWTQGYLNSGSTLAPGSQEYLAFNNVEHTDPGSTPQDVGNSLSDNTGEARTSESSIWNIDLVSGAVTVQWINPDGSLPTTYLITQYTFCFATGDPAAFDSAYGGVTTVTYKFLPRP
ncbi:WSC-domain-containing protein [Serendipita vermifera]|nr:WSC-domain-containing protein [Serendipita vermifera]